MGVQRRKVTPGRRFNPYRRLNGSFIPDGLARYKGLSMSDKWLWGRLYRYAGKDGKCYPTRDKLASDLGCSVRTIERGISRLIEHGFIEVEKRRGPFNWNQYYFLVHECLLGDFKDQAVGGQKDDGTDHGDKNVGKVWGQGDSRVAMEGDKGVAMVPTAVSYKEAQKKGSKKEEQQHSPGPARGGFVQAVQDMKANCGGVCSSGLSKEQEEYIELKMKRNASRIENPAGYRRTLEKQALNGRLDMSDLDDLRAAESLTRAVRRKNEEEKAEEEEHTKKVGEFRRDVDKVKAWIDEGKYSGDDLLKMVRAKGDVGNVCCDRLSIILKILNVT